MRRLNFLHEDNQFESILTGTERALLCDIWSTLKGEHFGGITKRNLC